MSEEMTDAEKVSTLSFARSITDVPPDARKAHRSHATINGAIPNSARITSIRSIVFGNTAAASSGISIEQIDGRFGFSCASYCHVEESCSYCSAEDGDAFLCSSVACSVRRSCAACSGRRKESAV
jgi:hypothetical protein